MGLSLAGASGAEGFGALGARADVAKVVVAVDPGGMAVSEADLNGVAAYLRSGLSPGLGLEHRQRRRRRESWSRGTNRRFLLSCIVAGRARAFFTQISEFVVAGVAVGPGNVHTRAIRNMYLDTRWLFSRV